LENAGNDVSAMIYTLILKKLQEEFLNIPLILEENCFSSRIF